jgi:hypothetical protein
MVGFRNDLGPLVRLSLESHGIPVTAVFDVLEEPTEMRFLAVVTPIAESQGLRVALFKIYTALENETFASQSFLRLNTLVLTEADFREIRRVMKKGISMAALPKLAHLVDVVIHATDDPKTIQKTGMLHLVPSREGSFQLSFGDLSQGGAMKPRQLHGLGALESTLAALGVGSTYARDAIEDLRRGESASLVISCSLEALYKQGLI